MERENFFGRRVFPLGELDGFYIGDGICVHITFENDERIAIDLFDTEAAAFDGDAADVIAQPIILNLRTGEAKFEPQTLKSP